MKVLLSPCHYVLDDSAGSEIYWAYRIGHSICTDLPGSELVTGFARASSGIPSYVHQTLPVSEGIDMSVTNAVRFLIAYSTTTNKLLKKRFEILHHVLPYGIGSTFNPHFIFKNRQRRYIIGPLQIPPSFFNYDVDPKSVHGGSTNKTPVKKTTSVLQNLAKYLSLRTLRSADALICINQETKSYLLSSGVEESRIMIIPPGVDTNKFVPAVTDVDNDFRIIALSQLIARKGVELIIEAVSRLRVRIPKVELTIVGDGPQRDGLEQRTNSLGLNQHIRFIGRVNHNEIKDAYHKGSVFVNMSRSEGFATTCLEAMSCGKAIVSSRVGGFSNAIEDGVNGYLVEIDDLDSLCKALETLLLDKQLRIKFAERARKDAVGYYDWDKVIIPQYLSLYQKLYESLSR